MVRRGLEWPLRTMGLVEETRALGWQSITANKKPRKTFRFIIAGWSIGEGKLKSCNYIPGRCLAFFASLSRLIRLDADEQFKEFQVFPCQMLLWVCLRPRQRLCGRPGTRAFTQKQKKKRNETCSTYYRVRCDGNETDFIASRPDAASSKTRSLNSPTAKCIAAHSARLWYWKILITSKSIVYVACPQLNARLKWETRSEPQATHEKVTALVIKQHFCRFELMFDF